jgi:hypothetical protein
MKNNKIYNDLLLLLSCLNSNNLKKQRGAVKKLLKVSNMNGPIEETEIDSMSDLIIHVNNEPGLFIYLDNPSGSTKSFGGLNKELTFHYGEWPELINPADNMGWDVIISSDAKIEYDDGVSHTVINHIKAGHNLLPIGYVPVNESESDWLKNASKAPPIGNDKIILSPNGDALSVKNMDAIKEFFDDLWQFDKIILF